MGKYLDIVRRVEQGGSTAEPPSEPVKRPEIVEATFRATDTIFLYQGAKDIAPMEFPLCLSCQSRRYWLGTEGKVVCSRCGNVRFEIIAMEFKAIQ
jgi:hypothetical protein